MTLRTINNYIQILLEKSQSTSAAFLQHLACISLVSVNHVQTAVGVSLSLLICNVIRTSYHSTDVDSEILSYSFYQPLPQPIRILNSFPHKYHKSIKQSKLYGSSSQFLTILYDDSILRHPSSKTEPRLCVISLYFPCKFITIVTITGNKN